MKHTPILVILLFILFFMLLGCKSRKSKDGFLSNKPQINNRRDNSVYKQSVKEMTVEEVTVIKGELILKGNYKIHSTSAVRFLGFYEEKKIKNDTLFVALYPDFEGIGKDSKKQAEWHLKRKLNKEERNIPYVSVQIVGNDYYKTYLNQTN